MLCNYMCFDFIYSKHELPFAEVLGCLFVLLRSRSLPELLIFKIVNTDEGRICSLQMLLMILQVRRRKT